MLDRAEGIYMWDKSGKCYIDGSSGAMVSNIGHSNPKVLEAMRLQMEKSTFGYRLHFETEASEALAEKLASLSPDGFEQAFFVSGGSEAVESAIKLARQYTIANGEPERWKIVSRQPSYHGSTLGALAITGYTPLTTPFAPMMQAMPKIPAPRAYLDGLDPGDPVTGLHYANMLEAKINSEGPKSVLAFIVEPVGGASTGALVPPDGYMQRIREICDRYGVLMIHDEVMSGGGRTGRFFASEHWDGVPDLIALSKGFGAGYMPLGAMIAHERIVETVLDSGGFAHGFTYSGHPAACAVALASIRIMQNEHIVERVREQTAPYFNSRWATLAEHPIVGEARSLGLVGAIEIVKNKSTRERFHKDLGAGTLCRDFCVNNGLVMRAVGDTMIVSPPLVIENQQVDEMVEKAWRCLDLTAESLGDSS